ncbi:unnamed protein product, partial [Ectocarpus fasciculatus]
MSPAHTKTPLDMKSNRKMEYHVSQQHTSRHIRVSRQSPRSVFRVFCVTIAAMSRAALNHPTLPPSSPTIVPCARTHMQSFALRPDERCSLALFVQQRSPGERIFRRSFFLRPSLFADRRRCGSSTTTSSAAA